MARKRKFKPIVPENDPQPEPAPPGSPLDICSQATAKFKGKDGDWIIIEPCLDRDTHPPQPCVSMTIHGTFGGTAGSSILTIRPVMAKRLGEALLKIVTPLEALTADRHQRPDGSCPYGVPGGTCGAKSPCWLRRDSKCTAPTKENP